MKAERIEAIYSKHAEFRIEDVEDVLGIKWDDVEDYDIKWAVLHLEMKDGEELEYHDAVWGDLDAKRPDEINEYDKDYSLVRCVKPNWRAGTQ